VDLIAKDAALDAEYRQIESVEKAIRLRRDLMRVLRNFVSFADFYGKRDAIFQACMLRFRPIMMTTFAALFGGLPLALGNGVGAELRRPLGIVIVGGLIVSQALTLFTTPVIYLYFGRLAAKFSKAKPAAENNKGSLPAAQTP